MTRFTLILFSFISIKSQAQENPTVMAQPIVAEGKRLYRSEIASWHGTDLFLERYKNRENVGGYFSYADNEQTKCIFFSKADLPKVIGTITFDNTYNPKTAGLDLSEREFTKIEKDLFAIRKIALDVISTDSLFKFYKNTNLNLIPLINGKDKKVYVLTGPATHNVVIFGNDYLITFDDNNQITAKSQLHKNIILINYGGHTKENEEIQGTVHTHLPESGDFITATDICTLMLYEKFAGWKQHNVVSKKYLNIWNCLTNELTVIPMSTLDKINKDQEEKKKED